MKKFDTLNELERKTRAKEKEYFYFSPAILCVIIAVAIIVLIVLVKAFVFPTMPDVLEAPQYSENSEGSIAPEPTRRSIVLATVTPIPFATEAPVEEPSSISTGEPANLEDMDSENEGVVQGSDLAPIITTTVQNDNIEQDITIDQSDETSSPKAAEEDSSPKPTALSTVEPTAIVLLTKKPTIENDGEVDQNTWYEDSLVQIKCTKYGIVTDETGVIKIRFDLSVENNSNNTIIAGITDDFCNGVRIGTTGNFTNNGLSAHETLNTSLTVSLEPLMLQSMEEIMEYKFAVWVDNDASSTNDEQTFVDRTITEFSLYT